MKYLATVVLILSTYLANAQDHWTIRLNSETLLTATKEDSLNNKAVIDDIKKGNLIITYRPEKMQDGWGRRIFVLNDRHEEIFSKEGLVVHIAADRLKEWEDQTEEIQIFTIAIAKDPRIKTKLKPMHLATIKLDD